MKRRTENSGLSKDNYLEEEDNEQEEAAGTFQVAPKEELAQRKILKVVRKSSNPVAPATTNSFGSIDFSSTQPASNPFGSMKLPASGAPIAPPASSAQSVPNPFSSIKLPTSGAAPVNAFSATTTNSEKSDGETEYQKKMKKLNQSFLSWSERQLKENPVAVWKEGVQDYLKHQGNVKDKYGNEEEIPKKQVVTAPVVVTIAASAPAVVTTAASAPALPSFPMPQPTKEAAPVPFTFSFPSASASTAATIPFFTMPSSSSTATISFTNSFSTSNAFQVSNKTNDEDGDEGGDDDEGEKILEPEKILKNENDTDIILLEVDCKLHRFDKNDNDWKDLGKGSFRVTEDPQTNKRRMLVRNTMGRITFNAAFYKGMKIKQEKKNNLQFTAVVTDDKDPTKGEPKTFLFKFKEADCALTKETMEKYIALLN